MRVGVLGPVGAGPGGIITPIGSPSQRLVLAVLASRPGETVSADLLADALWDGEPPRTAATTLRTYVSRLRTVLADGVTIRPGGYALDLPDDDLDAGRFEALLRRAATAPRPEATVATLEEALGLWRGPAFGDLADLEVLRGPARRLNELRLAAQEDLAAGWLRSGQAARAVAAAEDLVATQPFREGAWAVLVEALAEGGRAQEALRAYQRAAGALAEAGLMPSARLREAEAAALAAPALPALAERLLPVRASALVGREDDLAAVEESIAAARLVTVCGPGGVGKTRLALAVAERLGPKFRWGARLVALASVDDPAAVPTVVADALGLSVEEGGAAAALAGAGNLDLLVVLDNCEHVIDTAAAVAGMLLTGGSGARVLATSRERLGVDGERTWTLAPLSLAGDDPPARRLFLDRARAGRPGAGSGREDIDAADRIVRRLDGLPLAIEMAAGRAASLPLGELAERLDELGPLTSARRDAEDRHRTLSAVVEWSEALLTSEERDLLADLSIFAWSMDEADVAAVTGRAAPLEGLCRLAERSLLVADTTGARARFRMLATIRDHAAARLVASGRADQMAARHARHVVALAEAADADLRSSREADAAGRLDGLMPDLRAAHAWARRADSPLAVRLCAAMHLFAQSRLRDEPLSWAAGLADDIGATPGAPVVLASTAQRAVNAGDLDEAEALARRGVAMAKTAGEAFFGLEVLADVALFRGSLDVAEATARQVLDAAEEIGDDHAATFARSNAALAAAYAGRFADAEAALHRRSNPPAAPSDLGWLAYTEGEIILDRDPGRALSLLDQAVAVAESVGNRYLGGVARVSACSLRARTGDPAEAMGAFASVIDGWRRQGAKVQQLTTLRNLVVLLARMGSAAEAALLLGAVERDTVAPTFGQEAARLVRVRHWVTETLGAPEAGRRIAAGGDLELDEAAEVALSWL